MWALIVHRHEHAPTSFCGFGFQGVRAEPSLATHSFRLPEIAVNVSCSSAGHNLHSKLLSCVQKSHSYIHQKMKRKLMSNIQCMKSDVFYTTNLQET